MVKFKLSRLMGVRLVGIVLGVALGFAVRVYLLPLALSHVSRLDIAFTKHTLKAIHGGQALVMMRWWIAVLGAAWAFWIHTSMPTRSITGAVPTAAVPERGNAFNAAFLFAASAVLSPYTVLSGAFGLLLFGACAPRQVAAPKASGKED